MELLITKCIISLSVMLLCFGGAYLPLLVSENVRVMSVAYVFSGGVLLSAAMLEMLPDAIYNLKSFNFPMAQFWLLAGFCATLCAEHLVTLIQHSSPAPKGLTKSEEDLAIAQQGGGGGYEFVRSLTLVNDAAATQRGSFVRASCAPVDDPNAGYGSYFNLRVPPSRHHSDAVRGSFSAVTGYGSMERGSSTTIPPNTFDESSVGLSGSRLFSPVTSGIRPNWDLAAAQPIDEGLEAGLGSGAHSHGVPLSTAAGLLPTIVLVCAIAFDSIMEGLAIGLASTSGTAVNLGIAVVSHKAIDGFAAGMALLGQMQVEGGSHAKYIAVVAAFSTVSPVSCLIGTAVQYFLSPPAGPWPVAGVITALAAGTFMYVGVIEALSKQLEGVQDKYVKLLAMLVGWLAMASIVAITERYAS